MYNLKIKSIVYLYNFFKCAQTFTHVAKKNDPNLHINLCTVLAKSTLNIQ